MLTKIFSYCRSCWKNVSCCSLEPIAILMFLAFYLWFTAFQTGLYQTVCYQLYHSNRSINCRNKIDDEKVQNNIQRVNARWFMILMLAFIVPGTISSCILGPWADTAGRKTNIVLCISGMVFAMFPLLITVTWKLTPLWILAVVNVVCGSFGFLTLLLTSAMAYLSDTVLDKKDLTVRMVMLSVLMSMSGVAGSLLSGVLLSSISIPLIILITEALFALSLFYALFRLEQLPPEEMRKKILALKMNNGVNNEVANTSSVQASEQTPKHKTQRELVSHGKVCVKTFCITVPKLICKLAKDTYWTYAQPRPGKQRTYLIITAIVFFLNMMADTGVKGNVMGQYVMKDPFNWTDGSKLGYWRAAASILSLIGNVFGIVIFKKLLQLKDTTVMLISAISAIAELTLIGISTSDWMLYFAAAIGCLSNLLIPTLASFTTQIVSNDEVGKSLVASGLASSLAFTISTAAFQEMYQATLLFYAGFVFLFGAFMMGACFFIILWIHLNIIHQEIRVEPHNKNNVNVVDSP